MDMRQLRYFHTIASEGQITRAAKKLHMAQPPLSQTLKMLEDELGVTLLERNGRKMELTEAGIVLYKKAETLFHSLNEAVVEVKETGKGIKGRLSIGCVKSCFSFIPERISKFRKQYPNVTFELREGDSFRLAEQLYSRNIDLAVVRLPLEMRAFSSISLPDENYVAVLPESWVNENSKMTISMKELAKTPLLLLLRISGVGQYEIIIDQFKNHGLKPNVICECPDADMILELVTEEIGATVIPKSAISNLHQSGINVLQIEDANIVSQSSVIWLKDRYLSKSAHRFIDLFHGEVKQIM
ncbi:LysR family transcriptional regulator [Lentibacillus sp. Marseille-P4043]|uniref:LysR family transcriptional regulator n=1 Tax=Lentibacillus sp. Marseille-P4043 TaxID=2040293 RepID=UPI000D0B5612|nr:LysR family transcriptional regulator [Lentibacillus sp. Marseille-P4043]